MKRHSRRHSSMVDARPGSWAERLHRHPSGTGPENLHRITPTLYRSGQPRREDVPTIEALGIRTVLSFRSFNSDDRAFRDHPGIVRRRVRIDTWSINDDEVLRALIAIREAERKGPVLVHCWHGADRTGVVVALYRMVVQGWSKDAARHEMFRGGYGYHTLWRNIPRYLERVDVEAMRRAFVAADTAASEPIDEAAALRRY
ncbi:tyrosine-protein phosphatase [Variovorax humicola]|uniref:Tyrosine-protein phosphatase n=1 Tax=Variovorax humicola TaxID=1769758 RepID=A0ABU8W9Y9_9BURK